LERAAGWGRPWLAVVTADHGESLGEGGRWAHGSGLHPELLAVPLLLLGEGVQSGRVAAPVGHAAVMPTLLAAAGIPCAEPFDLRRSAGMESVAGEFPPDLLFRISAGHKLVYHRRRGPLELYDLAADPLEQRNLLGQRPALAARLAEGLAGKPVAPHLSPGDMERFRALGYLGQ
jgi:choline-sulfatase